MLRHRLACFTLFLFVTSFVQTTAFAQYNPGLVADRRIPVGGTPFGIATADLNHDGFPDVVIADGSTTTFDANDVSHTTIHGIAVVLGTSGGGFRPPTHFATTESASFVALADVDNDGNPDVITASDDPNLQGAGISPGGSVQVLRGRADGTFGAPAKYSFPGWYAVSVLPADLNNDGYIDLEVSLVNANDASQGSVTLLNNGNGTFRAGTIQPGAMPLAVADFNHNGRLGVAAIYAGSGSTTSFSVQYGNGGNSPASLAVPAPSSKHPALVGDFNGDGYPDLAYVNADAKAVTLLLNNGNNTFTPRPLASPSGGQIAGMCSADFNGDGIEDLATVDEAARLLVYFLKSDGSTSSFTQYRIAGTGALPAETMVAVDLNKDGIPDIAVAATDGNFLPVFTKPGGAMNAVVERNLGGVRGLGTVTADFNRDGIPDLAVMNYGTTQGGGDGTIQIFLGIGDGHFRLLTTQVTTGMAGLTFAAGDVNGDGKIDLVAMNDPVAFNNPEFAIILGNGDGTFQAPVFADTIPPGFTSEPNGPSVLLLADVNHDGKLDLVNYVGVHLGNGNGTFQAPIPLPNLNAPFALGDFNNDGKLDLVTLSQDRAPELSIYPGSGDGHFAAATYTTTLPFGDFGNNTMTIGHFTRDGNLSVVAGSDRQFSADANTVVPNGAFVLLAGNGDGTLKPPIIYQVPSGLWRLTAADMNADGVQDVLAFNNNYGQLATGPIYYTNLVSLFTSNGDGTLKSPVNFGTGNVSGVAVADFNRDGALDLAGTDGSGEDIMMNSRGLFNRCTSSGTAKAGQLVTVKCTFTPSFHYSGDLYGRVTFYDGKSPLATVNLVKGTATLTTSTLGVGAHTISATFLGNGNYNANHTPAFIETITP